MKTPVLDLVAGVIEFQSRYTKPELQLSISRLIAAARIHIVDELVLAPLGQVIDEILISKRNANRREHYVKSLNYYLRRFAKGRERMLISEMRVFEIELWLSQFKNHYARQTWLNRISSLFSFAVRRGYIAANPCARVERVTIERKPPIIMSPEQAERLMAMASPACRAYMVIGTYAGVRPEEIMHLTWEQIDWQTKTLRIEHTKTRRRRIVPLEPKCLALLKSCQKKTGKIAPCSSTIRRLKRRLCNSLGYQNWPQDLLRHTAASYLIALYGDAGKVSMLLGNSASVLMRHYYQPVGKADCNRFWSLRSKKV